MFAESSRRESLIANLRQRVSRMEGVGMGRDRPCLPFGIPAIDDRLSEGLLMDGRLCLDEPREVEGIGFAGHGCTRRSPAGHTTSSRNASTAAVTSPRTAMLA